MYCNCEIAGRGRGFFFRRRRKVEVEGGNSSNGILSDGSPGDVGHRTES